jgi:hypothetical protein
MPTFAPTTYGNQPLGPELDHQSLGYNMFRYFDELPVGYHVLITSGVATTSPGRKSLDTNDISDADSGSGEGGKAWFRGGLTYTVTAAEQTILEAAGYTVT